eukprot:TRINITY_DN2916_c0_g1_i1.p1 TRINITY_DN2916_c0_g1~~TRINITY_DN2916_c0_g1_i1.p1  ORF type:complete len:134 (-),score=33.64 TRINITY_DN2916_c0_g1_i1:137-490(-)
MAEGKWTTGLCDCCSDFETCCCAWCCPCHQFGKNIAEFHGQESDYWMYCCVYLGLALCLGCECIVGCIKRAEIRKKYNLPGNAYEDCCCHWCCWCCAISQEARELKARRNETLVPQK